MPCHSLTNSPPPIGTSTGTAGLTLCSWSLKVIPVTDKQSSNDPPKTKNTKTPEVKATPKNPKVIEPLPGVPQYVREMGLDD